MRHTSKSLALTATLIAFSSPRAFPQDYTNATNAAWCAGALAQQDEEWQANRSKYTPEIRSQIDSVVSSFETARQRHIAFAMGYFVNDPMTAAAFAMLGRKGVTACREHSNGCKAQHPWTADDARNKTDVWSAYIACSQENPDCKRIFACYN